MKQKYRETHKEQIKNYRKQKYKCQCGQVLARNSKSDHEKSKHHLYLISLM
jgi:predicted SprT family Zn-dependent metalloprotease